MIRFIDIRNQGTGNRFAFYSTGTDNFFNFNGDAAWSSLVELRASIMDGEPLSGISALHKATLSRLESLCPDWVEDGKEDDVESWFTGEED